MVVDLGLSHHKKNNTAMENGSFKGREMMPSGLSASSGTYSRNTSGVQRSTSQPSTAKGGALMRGWLYEDTHVVPGVVVKRYGAMFPHAIATFAKEHDKQPRDLLSLSNAVISPLVARVCTIKKRRTPIIMALTSNNCKTRKLTGFRISRTNPAGHVTETSIYFDEPHTAEAWREVLLLSTEAQSGIAPASSTPTAPIPMNVNHATSPIKTTMIQAAAQPRPAEEASVFAVAAVGDVDGMAAKCVGGMLPASPSMGDDHDGVPPETASRHPLDFRSDADTTPHRWAKLKHHNGVAVYLEDDPGNGVTGAMMVSAVVRATPSHTFKALMDTNRGRNVGNVFADGQLLQQGKDGRDVLLLDFAPGGMVGAVASPRDLVVARTWRQDDDGTYILLYQSTKHEAAPAPRGGGLCGGVVRGKVQAAGITISPLAPRFSPPTLPPGASPECLVTLVLNVDPGGWLSPSCWVGRCLPAWLRLAWAEPFVLSVIALRDKVEQARFAVQPISLVEGGGSIVVGGEGGKEEVEGVVSLAAQPSFLIPRHSVRLHTRTHDTTDSHPRHHRSTSLTSLNGAPSTTPDQPTPLTAALPHTASTDSMVDASEALFFTQPLAEGQEPPLSQLQEDQWCFAEGTCPPQYWECPGSNGYKVRGPGYLVDRKKVLAAEPVFSLVAVDLLRVKSPRKHIAPLLPSMRGSSAPFTFIVNILIPGPPHLCLIMSWAAEYNPSATSTDTVSHSNINNASNNTSNNNNTCNNISNNTSNDVPIHNSSSSCTVPSSPSVMGDESDADVEELRAPVDIAMARFLAGDDAHRNAVFKLIPRIAKGSWIIKQSVGSTPVILGRKLQCSYHRGQVPGSDACYLEVDVDVASSSVAAHVVGLVQNTTKSLIVDMAWLLEGTQEDELPEALLGTVRFNFVDLNAYRWLDTEDGRVYEQGKQPAHLH